MSRTPWHGVNAQRLFRSIKGHIAKLSTCEIGEDINVGLDGGKEFGFVLKSRDGAEFLISVVQTREARTNSVVSHNQVVNRVKTKEEKYWLAQERKRKRWLGEL